MNDKLVKIIARACNIDRPVLMHDKMDYVWTEKLVLFDELRINKKLAQRKLKRLTANKF